MSDKIGNYNFVDTAVGRYAIRMDSFNESISTIFGSEVNSWDEDPVTIAGERIVPWGADNQLPIFIRNLLEKNNLGPGILERKVGLLYGQGPMLYRYKVENNERVQEWIEDKEIQEWLDSWNYKEFIRNALTEYNHLKGVFVKYISGRKIRLGEGWIARLECLPSSDCRFRWPNTNRRNYADCKHIITGDFATEQGPFYKYPIFDKWDPAKHDVSIKYHSFRSFGRNFYSMSSFFGSIPWMQDANSIPEIIKYLNNNMIAAAYMVHVPETYWSSKKATLQELYPSMNSKQLYEKMEEEKDKLAKQLAEVMAGSHNAGKFFLQTDFVDDMGHEHNWKVEPIEMNVDKYIDAQAKISRIADSSTTSGFGLNPSLANIIIDGKGDSGSQMLYALKLFYGADTQIPEEICLEAINDAIRINFPQKKGIFLGLYRKVINKEDNVTASARPTNQV